MEEEETSLSVPGLRSAISGVILLVLFLQTVAAFDLGFGPIGRAPFLYPFLDYPMYSRIHYEGEPITRNRVYAVLADSSEVLIQPSELGLSFWLYHNGLVRALHRRDTEKLRTYAEMYLSRHGAQVIRFRLEDHPLVLTRTGVREGRPQVLRQVSLPLF